jgi:hypothetical protein
VDAYLMRQANGGPAIIFDKRYCTQIIRALNGGYRYAKMRNGQTKPNPYKNEHSHIADALQYLCCAAHGGLVNMLSTRLANQRGTIQSKTMPSGAWT